VTNPLLLLSAKWDTSTESFDELIMGGLQYAVELSTSLVETQRKGFALVLDMSGFGFSHARQCSYGNVMKMANCIIFGSPARILGCSIINSPYVFEKVYQVVKFAIPERFREFVIVTKSDFSTLHSQIDPSKLPPSLGGGGGIVSEESAYWLKGMEDDIFKHEAVVKLLQKIDKKQSESLVKEEIIH
jgi:hypothetical protein